jgi:riboflavin synthase
VTILVSDRISDQWFTRVAFEEVTIDGNLEKPSPSATVWITVHRIKRIRRAALRILLQERTSQVRLAAF